VLPPWFRTTWATLLFLVAGILAGGLVLRLWTRYLWRRNQALQRRIELATEDLRDRERQLASQASALERMNAQLRELSAQKNQFLGIVAHDLRNPLTSIMLTSQLIQEEEDVADMRRRAGAIARVGGEMEHLINSFLDLSALETGGIRSEPGPLCVAELLDELVQRHGPWAEAKNIALRIESAPATARVFADTKFVSAVLDNLISNAIKFSPRESTVLIRVENIGGQVRVSVVDEGPGLNEADRARLFGRFARLSAQPTGGEKSVGLGLSIAKQMVEACGGRIWVESEPGQGAAFIVELPGSEF
jgi:signal transduction histidine kinase